MKTKLITTVLLTIIGLVLVLGGVTHAQSLNDHQPIHQQTISNTVYLPFVSRPPCTPNLPAVFIATSQPLVHVGEFLTVTGAIVNDCTIIGQPHYYLDASPEGLLDPSHITTDTYPTSIDFGAYQEFTFTVQAVNPGVVTVTTAVRYETQVPNPPYWHWVNAWSNPAIVRVLP